MVAERPVPSPPIIGSEQIVERWRIAPSQLRAYPEPAAVAMVGDRRWRLQTAVDAFDRFMGGRRSRVPRRKHDARADVLAGLRGPLSPVGVVLHGMIFAAPSDSEGLSQLDITGDIKFAKVRMVEKPAPPWLHP